MKDEGLKAQGHRMFRNSPPKPPFSPLFCLHRPRRWARGLEEGQGHGRGGVCSGLCLQAQALDMELLEGAQAGKGPEG